MRTFLYIIVTLITAWTFNAFASRRVGSDVYTLYKAGGISFYSLSITDTRAIDTTFWKLKETVPGNLERYFYCVYSSQNDEGVTLFNCSESDKSFSVLWDSKNHAVVIDGESYGFYIKPADEPASRP